ncbi:MAG: putative Ig domain-containing protein, partial [Betaproteobacteria bacterium]
MTVAAAPSLAPTSQTVSGQVNAALTATSAISASNFTGAPTYSISPALPAGLSLNTGTGEISGTPTASQSATTHTLTATSGAQTATASISLTVAAQ